MNLVYAEREYNIYLQYGKQGKGYIVHNTEKSFMDGHSHINNFNTAKYIVKLCKNKRIPYHLSKYLLISLYRVSNDNEYREKINILLVNKTNNQKQKRRFVKANKYCY